MSITTTYTYSSGSSFQYDSSKITFSGGHALLTLINDTPGTFSQPYTSSADFTFNSTFTEFAGGLARQKDNRPAGFLAYYAWTTPLGGSNLDGNYGTTAVTVSVSSGSPAVTGGFLNLTGASNKAVSLANAGTYTPVNVGTIAFRFKPNYSGIPASPQYIIASANGSPASLLNYLSMRHVDGSGHIFIELYNSAGTGVGTLTNKDFGLATFVSGTVYEIVLQIDITTGATKLFIDGVQLGATDTSTGTRSSASTIIFVGHDTFSAASSSTEFSVKDLSFYNAIIAPGSCFLLQSSIYMGDAITLPVFTYPGAVGHIQLFSSFAVTETNAPRYVLNGKYWNGSAWAVSNSSYSQATTAANATSNIGTLSAADTLTIILVTQSSNTIQMSADNLAVNYTGQIYPTSDPTISPTVPIFMDEFLDFSSTLTAVGSDSVKFHVKVGATKYYFTGSAWEASDGSYAQSSTSAQITAGAPTITGINVGNGDSVTLYAVLHSTNGTTSPTLTAAVITSSYFGPLPTGPNTCVLWGYIVDQDGSPQISSTVSVINPSYYENQGLMIAPVTSTAITNSVGYFEMDLYETTTVNVLQTVKVTSAVTGVTKTLGQVLIPNSTNVNMSTLAFSS